MSSTCLESYAADVAGRPHDPDESVNSAQPPSPGRHGIGRSIMAVCKVMIRVAGFRSVGMVTTLAGERAIACWNRTFKRRREAR